MYTSKSSSVCACGRPVDGRGPLCLVCTGAAQAEAAKARREARAAARQGRTPTGSSVEPPTLDAAVLSLRPLVEALEHLFVAVKRHHPDMPRIVVVVATGTLGKTEALGWFGARRWQRDESGETFGEITIGAEGLKHGADELLNTVLHESAHALATARGLQDTSRQGRHHNRVFATLAAEVGLLPPTTACPRRGFSACTTRPETHWKYAVEVRRLSDVLGLHRVPTLGRGRTGSADSAENRARRVKAVCGCDVPRILYVVASVLEKGPIACGICRSDFVQANT